MDWLQNMKRRRKLDRELEVPTEKHTSGDDLLRMAIEDAIREYNRYRSPEAKARIVFAKDDRLKVEFTGSFCFTCGYYDYFDDLNILLEEKGLGNDITNIDETDEGAVVEFSLEGATRIRCRD